MGAAARPAAHPTRPAWLRSRDIRAGVSTAERNHDAGVEHPGWLVVKSWKKRPVVLVHATRPCFVAVRWLVVDLWSHSVSPLCFRTSNLDSSPSRL
jgi:hypothetical protein